MTTFSNRYDAGEQLSRSLEHLRAESPLVLGLARGGVVVANAIAQRLGAEVDVLVVRKVGAPWQPEFGIAAVAPGGIRVYDPATFADLGITPERFDSLARFEEAELRRRLSAYRGDKPLPSLLDRTVIIADDGLATGISALAAVRYVRSLDAGNVVLAVPVCTKESCEALRPEVDEFLCLFQPEKFRSVSEWYADFRQVEDEEVVSLLAERRVW